MSNEEILTRLKEIKIENYIWIIYIFIIFMSYYSNFLEKEYLIKNNKDAKKEYRNIITLIFTILTFVYIYFAKDSYDSIKSLKETDSIKKKNLTTLSFIASLLVAISGIIFLYIAINDEDLNIELAFN